MSNLRNCFTAVLVCATTASLALVPSNANAQRWKRARRVVRAPAARSIVPRPVARMIAPAKAPASFLVSLPTGVVSLTVGKSRYYRHGQSYYQRVLRNGRWTYVLVTPPVGVATTLPKNPEKIVVNGQVYYRADNVYYTQTVRSTPTNTTPGYATTAEYVVTKPPVGIVVDSLPADAAQVVVRQRNYYRSKDVYYLPIQVANATKFVVVEKP